MIAAVFSVEIELRNSATPDLEEKLEAWGAYKSGALGALEVVSKIAMGMKGEAASKGLETVAGGAFDAKLLAIKGQITTINKAVSSLNLAKANLSLVGAMAALQQAMTDADVAQGQFAQKEIARVTAYRKLADLQKALVTKVHGSVTEQEAAYTAIRAIPLIEEVIGQAESIVALCVVPGGSTESSQGAGMCTNVSVLIQAASVVAGCKAHYQTIATNWRARLVSVHAMIDKTAAY